MIRMGRGSKSEQADSEHNTDNPTATNSQYSYTPYQQQQQQSAEAAPLYPQAGNTATTSRAVTESESLARDIKEGVLSGFVGNGTVLTGEASFKAMLRVDGHLSGHVSSDGGTLLVGTNGRVDANIEVAVAMIHGTVNGDIIASQRLELGRSAKVNGNIQTPSLVIEQGAVFEGSCRMMQQRAAFDKRDDAQSEGTLDTSSMPATATDVAETPDYAGDSTAETSDYASASDVAS